MDKQSATERVYEVARSLLGQRLSGNNPMFGCAMTVNAIVDRALNLPVGGGASTNLMVKCLTENDKRFKEVSENEISAGVIVISPTGYGDGSLPNGHVGILANDTSVDGSRGIISNDSESGEVHEYWTLAKWKKYYGQYGGFPVRFFEIQY